MRVAITWLFIVLATLATSIADDAQAKKTLSVAIRYLDDEQSPDAIEIEKLLQDVDSSSPLSPIAIQAAGFLYIKSNEYSKAWKILSRQNDSLDRASQSLKLGHDRLMLWLALESGQTEKATELFKKLVKQLLANDNSSASEQRILADFLGRICAIILEDSNPKSIPHELIRQAIARIESHESKATTQQFRAQLDEVLPAAKALAEIHDQILSLSDQDAAAKLLQARKDMESARINLENTRSDWESERNNLRQANEALSNQEKQTRKLLHLLRNTEEPGRPRPPTLHAKRPTEPKGSRYDANASKNDWDRYDRDMRKYRQEESEYLRDLQTFPARLADWQDRNAKRQQRLNADHAQSSAGIPPLQAAADAQRKLFEPFEQAKSRSELESKKAEQDVRFIEASIQAKTSDNKRSIHRPSLFPVLDYASESERLISAMRAATKTSD